MADLKLTLFKKNTPIKSPKIITPNKNITSKSQSNTTYVTPTKKMKLGVHEPSPSIKEKMCKSLKQENTKLKNEITEMFCGLLFAGNIQQIGDLRLENLPILKLYELYLAADPRFECKRRVI
ncbi:hypothetical protein AAHA92_04841 [Salvia divinorum]|uniref:Uncharacterized protein n=1 Tax=Salvia divinorum TaxID=28513 RepID=A0ABD1I0J3_SALDI